MKRIRGHFDNFDAIRDKAKQMVWNGTMTHEQATAWIKEQDALEYASVETEPLPEPEPRTSFPDQGHSLSYGRHKNGNGTIVEPEAKYQSKWDEKI